MGCVTSASSAATSTAAPIPTPTLYCYFADRILATKHNGTDGPNEMDKRYLRQCAKSDLIAPEDEPSLLELALFSPWFEYLLETKKCDPRELYDDHRGRQTTTRIKLLGHRHFSILSQAVHEWNENEALMDEHSHAHEGRGDHLTNEQWWAKLPDSSMRAKFGQPAEWAKFREPAILFGLTALLGTPFPFPFPVVVIGSMIWAVRHALLLNAFSFMLDRSSELCPELVGMFERAQKTAQSIVKQLHQQMEDSLTSEEMMTPLQSLEIESARSLEADLKRHGETMEEILRSRESQPAKIEKVQVILDKLADIQYRLLDHMQSRATREAINANTEALKETTRVAREATEMMRASNIEQEAGILDGARRR